MAIPFLKKLLLHEMPIGWYFEPKPCVNIGIRINSLFHFTYLKDAVDIYKHYWCDRFHRVSIKCGLDCCVFGVNEYVDLVTRSLVYSIPNGHQQAICDRAFEDLNDAQLVMDSVLASSPLPSYFDGPNGLYEYVEKAIRSCKNVGPLTVYDTAIRIGQNLNPVVEPQKFVYMPSDRGPLDGALKYFKLIGMPQPKLLKNPNRFDVTDFNLLTSTPYSLTPFEIEDFLCVMHNHL